MMKSTRLLHHLLSFHIHGHLDEVGAIDFDAPLFVHFRRHVSFQMLHWHELGETFLPLLSPPLEVTAAVRVFHVFPVLL